jgi:ribosomal protein S18 acetylase RimI-like enzyme
MQIRPIGPDEVATFAAADGRPDRTAETRDYVERLFAAGATRPEWCYLAERDDRPVARVGLWTLPSRAIPLDLILLDAPWDEPELTTGTALLRAALRAARDLGATHLGHTLDTPPMPPQWQDHLERRVLLLGRLGFTIERQTRRFAWRAETGVPGETGHLRYRTLAEVGEAAFLAALEEVSTGSLDQHDREARARVGPTRAARDLLTLLQGLEYAPEWWQLAYTPQGDLVGLAMPAKTLAAATIGYIGVVPAYRGRGHINDLLARCTATLSAAGFTEIRADTDLDNAPMANAFRRAGWTEFATRREYGIALAEDA